MITPRLIYAIVSIILEEAAIVAIVLWGLPQADVNLPLWALIIIMLAWLGISVVIYRVGSRALRRKPVAGLLVMAGSRGKAAGLLNPNGFVRVKGELWEASSTGERIAPGEKVTVVGQEGLKLIVRPGRPDDIEADK